MKGRSIIKRVDDARTLSRKATIALHWSVRWAKDQKILFKEMDEAIKNKDFIKFEQLYYKVKTLSHQKITMLHRIISRLIE